jgi:hypothetical protein
VNCAPFSCYNKINPSFQNPGPLPSIAKAIPFFGEERIGACPELSAKLPLKLCPVIRILRKPNCYEGGEV